MYVCGLDGKVISEKSGDIYFMGKDIVIEDAEDNEIIEKIKNDYSITLNMEEKIENVHSSVFENLSKRENLDFSICTTNAIWTFTSNDITNTKIDLNPTIELSKERFNEIKTEKIENGIFIKFKHDGVLPGKANIDIDISGLAYNHKEGEKVYLYYYNPKENRYEFISETTIDSAGYVNISLNHCSSYVLSKDKIEQTLDNDNESKTNESSSNAEDKADINKKIDTNKTEDNITDADKTDKSSVKPQSNNTTEKETNSSIIKEEDKNGATEIADNEVNKNTSNAIEGDKTKTQNIIEKDTKAENSDLEQINENKNEATIQNNKKTNSISVNTGDNSNIIEYCVGLLISMLFLILVLKCILDNLKRKN